MGTSSRIRSIRLALLGTMVLILALGLFVNFVIASFALYTALLVFSITMVARWLVQNFGRRSDGR